MENTAATSPAPQGPVAKQGVTAVIDPQAQATITPQAQATPTPPQDSKTSLQNSIVAGNIPQIVLHMITYATEINVSDIHIEPLEKVVRVRFRQDGELQLIIEYPSNIHPAIVSRIKIMSGLKIDEQRIPQDGRMQITARNGKGLDLRISTLPTINGEKIVGRIQDKSKEISDLPELGVTGENLKKMERFTQMPNGVILVTGPTGSGKTNTLYSVLNRLNKMEVNIMTFEDPVEYQMDGLSQSQVKPEIDYNFAAGLRTALRQDPDIIMVGEIRDQETIEIAIRAALTGHLVLSTIHTNSAVSTLTRITDMGLKGFLIASAIRGIIAQRLVRTLCPHCREAYLPEANVAEEIKASLQLVNPSHLEGVNLDQIQLYKGKGCDQCNQTGLSGRTGLFEIMEMDRHIGELIMKNAPDSDLTEIAKKNGMITLKQDGYLKALQGIIPLEEVYRVTQ